ncbi:HAD family hydrolase [Cellvibrio sp. ARAG 10.3]|uniref:HAD family hydrolase n=1 Tax=Cellvibrio sp. ARAG 10.3 TaxID=3451358 RepID=UPI003F47400D
MNLKKYQTLVFDCDGVVLNSNKVKTEAFYKAALPYGEFAAQQLVDYHVARGGISRYKKFEWFLSETVVGRQGPSIEVLLESYATEVRQGLSECEVADGLFELRGKTEHANWLIVSGGDQQELREVFTARGMATLFDGGIFGSPDSKDMILEREKAKGNIKIPALFLGDSRYDHLVASAAKLDFVFLAKWSEFCLWPQYCRTHKIEIFESLACIT